MSETRETVRDGAENRGPGDATIREGAPTTREGGGRESGESGGDLAYRVIRRLPARGSEADLCVVDDGGVERVLKLYRPGLDPSPEILERYEIISRECPEHIVGVYKTGLGKRTGRWYELLEYIPEGSVEDALARGVKFNFKEFARELGEAVAALHSRGVAHRDLKPANILIRSLRPLDLVLTDFGISSALDGASVRETSRKGFTPMYAAPEDLLGSIVSRAADWWACGMIFYEILLGAHPFQGMSPQRIVYILTTRGAEIDESLPGRERALLAGLLTRNDGKRWGWAQIERWLAGDDDIPVFWEGAAEGAPPFVFEGRPLRSPRELALAFAVSEASYRKGMGMLARGSVKKWLQNASLFDEEAALSEEIADEDPELYIFKFVRKHSPEAPFSLYGAAITRENILNWLAEAAGGARIKSSVFSGRVGLKNISRCCQRKRAIP